MKIIGLAGAARVGKDTLYRFIHDNVSFKVARYSFADIIREDLSQMFNSIQDEQIRKTIHDGLYLPSSPLKESVRPLMAEYGVLMRNLTEGKYFINILSQKLKNNKEGAQYGFITDVRFCEYHFDEPELIHSLGGKVILLEREGIGPINEYERINLEKFKAVADKIVALPDKELYDENLIQTIIT